MDALIRFRGLHKAFGAKVVFAGLDLDVARGETLTVLGGSGVGKSVLLKMLIGLLRPDVGSILFDGIEVTELDEAAFTSIRGRIGMLFQGSALFDSMSVAENVAYGLAEHLPGRGHRAEIADRVEKVLEMVGLPGTERLTPAELSGGMKKRVALARTIALMPEVMLYDEPTTGLDPPSAARIAEVIRDINATMRVTSIVVTHDMHTAFTVSDRLAMIQDGRVVLEGPPRLFRDSADPYVQSFVLDAQQPRGMSPLDPAVS